MGFFSGLFRPKSTVEKTNDQLRKVKRSIEKDKKMLSTLAHERHVDGTQYTERDCVAYAFLYVVAQQYIRDGVEFDNNTAKWLLDTFCGGTDSYNQMFLLKFMMAHHNSRK